MTERQPERGQDRRIMASAMILAAGMGRRMRPLTEAQPKPMIEVAGKCLIDHSLDRLGQAGVKRAVINLHYMADMLEAHLKSRTGAPEILFSDERGALLDTGGGVKKALPLLGEDAFLVLNSDMIWTDAGQNTLARLAGAWRPEAMDTLMLMVPTGSACGYNGRGDFRMEGNLDSDQDKACRLTRRGDNDSAPFLYGGMHILHSRIFAGLSGAAGDGAFSLNRAWDRALAAGRLFGIAHGGQWMHVGTPEGVREAEDLLALQGNNGP